MSERRLVVEGPDATDPRVAEQRRLLAGERAGLEDRRLAVEEHFSKPFTVALIGLDGGEKQRWTEPVPPATVFAAVDAMPMRRRELRERGD